VGWRHGSTTICLLSTEEERYLLGGMWLCKRKGGGLFVELRGMAAGKFYVRAERWQKWLCSCHNQKGG
jgi:hypothetical protein